jgi:Zn finger protein HypA/HybF involved in hydrogenase expression
MGRRRKEIPLMGGKYACSKCRVELQPQSWGLYICPKCGYNYVIEEDEFDEDDPIYEWYDPEDDY